MADKLLNRTVEEINPLLDKLDSDYSRSEIDSLIAGINASITTIQTNISALSERIGALENSGTEGGENS